MRARRRVVVHERAVLAVEDEEAALVQRLLLFRRNDKRVAPLSKHVIQIAHAVRRQPIQDGVGRGWIEKSSLQAAVELQRIIQQIVRVRQQLVTGVADVVATKLAFSEVPMPTAYNPTPLSSSSERRLSSWTRSSWQKGQPKLRRNATTATPPVLKS